MPPKTNESVSFACWRMINRDVEGWPELGSRWTPLEHIRRLRLFREKKRQTDEKGKEDKGTYYHPYSNWRRHHERTRRWTENRLESVQLTFAKTLQSITGIPVHRGQGWTSFFLQDRKASRSITERVQQGWSYFRETHFHQTGHSRVTFGLSSRS